MILIFIHPIDKIFKQILLIFIFIGFLLEVYYPTPTPTSSSSSSSLLTSEPLFKISPNSLEQPNGYMTIVEEDTQHIYIGSKRYIYQVSKTFNGPINVMLEWRNNETREGYNNDVYIKYVSHQPNRTRYLELCGSDGLHHICSTFDKSIHSFLSFHSGFCLVPTGIDSTPQYYIQGRNLWAALYYPSNYAYIAKHFNRTKVYKPGSQEPKMIKTSTNVFNSNYDVKFLKIMHSSNKTYFIFIEAASEWLNYEYVFTYGHKISYLTRIGRICDYEENMEPPMNTFMTFFSGTLGCDLPNINNTKQMSYNEPIAVHWYQDDPDKFGILYSAPTQSNDLSQTTKYNEKAERLFTAMCVYSLSDIDHQMERSNIAIRDSTMDHWRKLIIDRGLIFCHQNQSSHMINKNGLLTKLLSPLASFANSRLAIVLSNNIVGKVVAFDIVESVTKKVILPTEYRHRNSTELLITMDLLFVGTDNGFIGRGVILSTKSQKLLRRNIPRNLLPLYNLILSPRQVRVDYYLPLQSHNPKLTKLMVDKVNKDVVIAVGVSFVERLPVGFCPRDCWLCNRNFDPLCQWNPKTGICEIRSIHDIDNQWNNNTIVVYSCKNEEKILKNLADISIPHQRQRYDTFWLIFILVLFVTIFIIVITLSLVVRYQYQLLHTHNHSHRRHQRMHCSTNRKRKHKSHIFPSSQTDTNLSLANRPDHNSYEPMMLTPTASSSTFAHNINRSVNKKHKSKPCSKESKFQFLLQSISTPISTQKQKCKSIIHSKSSSIVNFLHMPANSSADLKESLVLENRINVENHTHHYHHHVMCYNDVIDHGAGDDYEDDYDGRRTTKAADNVRHSSVQLTGSQTQPYSTPSSNLAQFNKWKSKFRNAPLESGDRNEKSSKTKYKVNDFTLYNWKSCDAGLDSFACKKSVVANPFNV